MNSRRPRRRRSWAQLAAVGCLLAGAPLAATASPEVVAVRGVPSSISQEYGPVVPLGTAGIIAAPTGGGVDFHDLSQPGTPRLGSFRTAGPVVRASAAGSTVFLFAGTRGIVAVDASDPASPAAAGSIGNLGRVALGAAAPSGGGLLAAFDSTLHFLRWDPPSGFTLLRSVKFTDGRRIAAIAASGDSFLVAGNRSGTLNRLFLTLYRLRAGSSAPESIADFAFNGHRATDLAWRGPIAFLGDGNLGVLVVNVPSRAIVRSVPVLSTKLVRSVDANDSTVVVAAEGRTFVRYRRAGAAGDSLAGETSRLLAEDPAHVRLAGDLAVSSTFDVLAVPPPDESAHSLLEFVSLSGGAEPAPVGDTGRVRRVAASNGLAYVADYSGGARVYRVSGADSSLVSVVPPAGNSRAVDVALDPILPLVYMASGPGGFEVFRRTEEGGILPSTTVVLPGSASAVMPVAPNLVAVAWRGVPAGVVFMEIDYNPIDSTVVAIARGSVGAPFVSDPRALAARDTVLYVADATLGVISIGFGNIDLPGTFGSPSGAGASDLDLAGTQLLVATRSRGLQIVDVTNPSVAILRGEFPAPPLLGVARNGASAALFLGEDGILVVDVGTPAAAFARGPIAVPGVARDGVWVGDTLLVAASLALERFLVSPSPVTVPALDVRLDPASASPRARITWEPVAIAGAVGLNLYRDLGTGSGPLPAGRRVNRDLLPPTATIAFDDSLVAGADHRYRLEVFLQDGRSIKVAEGTLFVSSAARVGRVYPNPFRPRAGALALLSYRLPAGSGTPLLTLRVYDVSGRLVRESRFPAATAGGFGVASWDGRDAGGGAAPSGIYFLKLTGAGLEDSRAVALLR